MTGTSLELLILFTINSYKDSNSSVFNSKLYISDNLSKGYSNLLGGYMTLFNFIKKNDARLIFGPAELRIIQKQLMAVELTQSERNRLSRSIRPKLDFIKRVSVFKDEFDVRKGGEVYKQLDMLMDVLLRDELRKKISRIHLFGSFPQNKMSMTSDVDVAIEFDNISKSDALSFKRRIAPQIAPVLDVSVFNTLPEKIKNEIRENGKVFKSFEG